MDLDGLDDSDDESTDGIMEDDSSTPDTSPIYKSVLDLCGGPDLIEVFGGSGSGKSMFSLQVLKEAMAEGENCLFVDTERNINDAQDLDSADYIYIPEWKDIYYYIRGREDMVSNEDVSYNTTHSNKLEEGYDVLILDSVGFPALVQYADYRVDDNAEQFQVFLEIESIFGHLKQYSQRNDCLIIVTNQPKSDLSEEADPAPFGDKAIYGAKEVWKTIMEDSSEIATTCSVNAYRSREAGRGKEFFRMKISSDGVEIEDKTDETASDAVDDFL